MERWYNGKLRIDDKIKKDNILKKSIFSPRRRLHRLYEPEAIIPLFHYSIRQTNPEIFSNVKFLID